MPSAIFLLMIEAEISGRLSTVAVTSRSAYSLRSAGAISGVWPISPSPHSAQHLPQVGQAQADVEAGDRLELVERAAGVAEAAAGDHRHVHAAGGGERREHQARLVADAAGRVLVGLRPGQVGEVEHVARAHHRLGERDDLGGAHAAEEHGHREGRGLVVGDVAFGVAADQELDLARGRSSPPSRFFWMRSTALTSALLLLLDALDLGPQVAPLRCARGGRQAAAARAAAASRRAPAP